MSYLKFDKEQLINLEYSLSREILRSNRAGSYMSTTLNGCNTRKYHGLLICPVSNFSNEKHLLLSSLDVSLVQEDEEFKLGIHQYKGGFYEPRGHKYIRNIEFGNIPKITYRIGGVVLSVEKLLVEQKEQMLIRYTIEDSTEKILLRFKPFLAFRNIHNLSKANLFVNKKFGKVNNGISVRLYDGYPDLYMQFSKKNDFIPVPDWYYNIEYIKEHNRGYEYLEDLFVPGYFEVTAEPGESLIFSAGTEKVSPVSLKQRFSRELKKRIHRFTFISSLKNAAGQFIIHKKNETDILAGFPWYDSITRQTFISLPGLAVAQNNTHLYAEVLNTYKPHLKNGLFPDNIYNKNPQYNSADSPLWFIWAVQHFSKAKRSPRGVWLNYSTIIKEILQAYANPVNNFLQITPEGLIFAEKYNTALTWMDSYAEGKPVIQRAGLPVEINALWYNALSFAMNMSKLSGDTDFAEQLKGTVDKAGKAFLQTFWNQGHDHLADVVKDGIPDWSVRPNMVIAAALEYSPLSREQKELILNVARKKLLTRKGLRTLSPDHLRYRGTVEGRPEQREASIHLGAVWPWLMQFFIEGYLIIHNSSGLPFARHAIELFEEGITEHCVGTISEMYNGDPPHKGKGAISQAWNVAGIIYSHHIINNFKSH
ncbi:MAG: amylo-alpha-1,6-glucosidase [Prolixibacteraceae bacterium]|nr:amylo-alpha-1,6-glucosidase [Prolixibacteraceae bacterium]